MFAAFALCLPASVQREGTAGRAPVRVSRRRRDGGGTGQGREGRGLETEFMSSVSGLLDDAYWMI